MSKKIIFSENNIIEYIRLRLCTKACGGKVEAMPFKENLSVYRMTCGQNKYSMRYFKDPGKVFNIYCRKII